jgi:hypothetical protein
VPQDRFEITGRNFCCQLRRFDPPIADAAACARPDVIDLKECATIADKRA